MMNEDNGEPLFLHPPEEWFTQGWTVDPDTGCWNWNIRWSRKRTILPGSTPARRRRIWEQHNGPAPPGTGAYAACHNRACVNPAHALIMTDAERNKWVSAQGRSRARGVSGEKSGCARLTEADVRFMLAHREIRHAHVAAHFGVTEGRVRQIRKGDGWRHLQPEPPARRSNRRERRPKAAAETGAT